MASPLKTELHSVSSSVIAASLLSASQAQTLPTRDNVLAFPVTRVLLPITLPCSPAQAQTQLQAVLRSPLGVYVISAHVSKKKVDIQFDIARDDIDFTLHTLIQTLPEAIIGPLMRRPGNRSH
jgi:hypothetical protein